MKLPVAINIKNKKVAIVGGGSIAYRKLKKLLNYSDNITVVSQSFKKEFNELSCVKLIRKKISDQTIEILEPFDFVVAATDVKAVNQMIGEYCLKNKILFNSVTFVGGQLDMLASFNSEDLNISISTNGHLPALSKKIKDDLMKKYTSEYLKLLKLLRNELIRLSRQEDINKLLDMSLEEMEMFYENLYSGNSRIKIGSNPNKKNLRVN